MQYINGNDKNLSVIRHLLDVATRESTRLSHIELRYLGHNPWQRRHEFQMKSHKSMMEESMFIYDVDATFVGSFNAGNDFDKYIWPIFMSAYTRLESKHLTAATPQAIATR